MKLWPTLGVAFLLIAAWGTSMRLSWSLGRENARNEAQASTLKSTVDTLNIISPGYRICSRCWHNSAWKITESGRRARREQLRNDIAKDECAHALPELVLLTGCAGTRTRHASAVSPAYTADADHTGNASPRP
ncbi:hypothetical protein EC179550_1021 [Escherichia coli 179550]|nr:hypothetical protein EC179550_1021 [Escherichia coli 179550]